MSFKNIRREDASRAVIVHGILLTYTLVALYPIFLVVINAFKTRKAIFRDPMGFPNAETFSLEGFTKVLAKSNFEVFFYNSFTVTVITIAIVLLLAAMAAWRCQNTNSPAIRCLHCTLPSGSWCRSALARYRSLI